MVQVNAQLSTGLPALDQMLKGVMLGDNIVWQVDAIASYSPFVKAYYETAVQRGRNVIYFRFARHAPLVPEGAGVAIRTLDPQAGFETFLGGVHKEIERAGKGAFYVFDCLSDLTADWYSDQMLGNFFMLTCPYLFDMETVAYFGLMRNYHSPHATMAISETTQLFLDVYQHKNKLYVHPLKVQQRYSPTMHMLHAWKDDQFVAVTDSATIAEVLTSCPRSAFESVSTQLDVWHRAFMKAEGAADPAMKTSDQNPDAEEIKARLLRMAVSRDPRVLALAEKYFSLEDLLNIGRRTIGTGLIGGKAVGMLLARAILHQTDARWDEWLEVHDSFYIGSDVFYTFLVKNGCWWMRETQKDPAAFLTGAEKARQRIMMGTFPEHIEQQFLDMLDYFGQSPIIVRSSSLLEDNFGNAFAGKYDSVFCVNQGSRHKRLADFITAVKTIYASTMSEKALSYRARFGILDKDEQMALLVQRVSGSLQGGLFFPNIAGVGFSFNPYVWNEYIDPKAGLLRLVFGLGTRAVDRFDDDYTRVIALNDPERRPEATLNDVRRFAQRKVDVLDINANQLVSIEFEDVIKQANDLPLRLFASQDHASGGPRGSAPWVLAFEELVSSTTFIENMREMLQRIQQAYDYPVDIEFTANFTENGVYRVNIVQCRPLQVKSDTGVVALPDPATIARENLVLETHGPIIGQSRVAEVDRIIYVVPSVYGHLPLSERYSVARLIGRLTHLDDEAKPETLMLLGPGRWGTTTPSLGVPVNFAEINSVSVLCEIVAMRDDLVPDVSMGTHFFSELVEMDMLYLAVFPSQDDNILQKDYFEGVPNRLEELLPEAAAFANVIKIFDVGQGGATRFHVCANTLKQHAFCYVEAAGCCGAGMAAQ
ncbi:MAG TPA: PEP/pyruvate-binding domain-containing protein [Candidatus Hydrogenedentes bacterium]|nr:PEP/pyruvate-binding domain-containing protein [Candidatus Hydrogenedentota bacterium]HOS02249.1 PEP/pyruvate-binding domain-containing protein [Candidatus Hydrogenedentota bacterium]